MRSWLPLDGKSGALVRAPSVEPAGNVVIAMALSTLEAPPSPLLGPSAGPLALRVCTGSLKGRTVHLTSDKCTLGSGPTCTLRLRGAGVRRLHCLILRGAVRTVARRWSPDTRLNDCPFTDAVLEVGDRLTLGGVELEVLGEIVKDESRRSLPADRQRIDALRSRLDLANRQGRRRLREAIVRIRKLRQRLADLDARRQQQAAESRDLQERLAVIESERRALAARIAELEQNQRELLCEAEARTASCEAREAATAAEMHRLALEGERLEVVQLNIERRHSRLDSERAELERLRSDAIADLDARARQATVRERALSAAQEKLAHDLAAWNAERDEQYESLELHRAELEALRAAQESREAELARRFDELRQGDADLEAARQQWLREQTRWESQCDRTRSLLTEERTALDRRQEEIQCRRQECERLEAELKAQAAALTSSRDAFVREVSAWQTERDRSQAALADRQAELERLQTALATQRGHHALSLSELEALRHAFAAEQQAWQRAKRDDETTLHERAREVERRESLVEQNEQRLRQYEADASRLQLDLDSRQTAIESAWESLDRDKATWQLEREAIEAQLSARSARLAEQEVKLAADLAEVSHRDAILAGRAAEVEAERQLLAEQRAGWDSEERSTRDRLDRRVRDIDERVAELEAKRVQLDAQAVELQASHEALRQQTDLVEIERQSLASRAAELDSRQQEIDRSVESVASRERETLERLTAALAGDAQHQAQVAALSTELASREAVLATQRDELEKHREAWQRQRDESAARISERSEELARREAELIAQRQALVHEREAMAAQAKEAADRTEADLRQRELGVAEQAEELARREAEVTAQRQALAHEREAMAAQVKEATAGTEAELRQRELFVAEQSETLARREAELVAQVEALAHEREAMAAQGKEAADRTEAELRQRELVVAEQSEALARQLEELAAQREAFAAERGSLLEGATAADVAAAELRRREDELETKLSEWELERQAREEDYRQQTARLAEESARLSQQAAEHAAAQDAIAIERASLQATAGAANAATVDAKMLRELDEAKAALSSAQGELETERTRLTRDTERQQVTLEQRAVELDEISQALAQARDTLTAQRQAADAEIASRREELAVEVAELARQREAFEAEKSERNARSDSDAEIEATRIRIERMLNRGSGGARPHNDEESASESASDRLAVQPSEDATPRQQDSDELSFKPIAETAPVTTAELLRRLGATPDFDQDEPAAVAPEPSSKPVRERQVTLNSISHERQTPAERSPAPEASASKSGDDEEESIDAYMARLLQRVGNKSPTAASQAPERPKAPEPKAKEPDVEQDTAPAPKPMMLDPREMAPRSLPPELSVNLSAMRELANMNARTAIDTHMRRTVKGATSGKFTVAITGWVVGLALIGLHLEGFPGALFGAAGCLIVGVTWTGYCIALRRRLKDGTTSVAQPQPAVRPNPRLADDELVNS